MPRREDHEVRQGHVGHWIKKIYVLSEKTDNIMADVASKQQTTALFLSTTVTRTRRHTELTKADKPVGKPVMCQRTFSSVFRAVFLHS